MGVWARSWSNPNAPNAVRHGFGDREELAVQVGQDLDVQPRGVAFAGVVGFVGDQLLNLSMIKARRDSYRNSPTLVDRLLWKENDPSQAELLRCLQASRCRGPRWWPGGNH
ncbi:hypothetical protein JCM33774_81670 [Actinophytocola sp. KF-1]